MAKNENLFAKIRAMKKLKNWHGLLPLAIFLVVTVPSGLYLVFSVPTMWAPDGGAHVARVFQIAKGGMRPVFINHEHGIGYGGAVPLNVANLKNAELDIVSNDGIPGTERQTKLLTPQQKQTINQISDQKISKERTLISYVNTAAYSPIAYLPAVVGVKTGMHLNFNLGHTLRLAMLFGFATFIACAGYALFILRKYQLKWIIMTMALLPLVVFQSAVITADSFLMSIIILFSALILKALVTDSKLTVLDKILLFICVLTLPLVKSVYFPLVFLILLIKKDKWSSSANYWWWAAPALILSMIGFAAWTKLTLDIAASNGLVRGDTLWHYGDSNIQEHFIITHPFGYLHAIVDYWIYNGKFFTDTYFGWLGFTYLPIPGLAQIAGWLGLGLSTLLAGSAKFKKNTAAIVGGLVILVALIIFTTLYIGFTLPMNSVVEGVQGRYFLPLTALLLAAIAIGLPKLRIEKNGLTCAKYILIGLMAFCLLSSVVRYGLAIT
jgi:uncharacterized membrane protein